MAGEISKENGKKGGRPRGTNAITAEVMRESIAKMIEPHVREIVDGLMEKAKAGDAKAAKELFDRAWGKPAQSIEAKIETELSTPIYGGLSR